MPRKSHTEVPIGFEKATRRLAIADLQPLKIVSAAIKKSPKYVQIVASIGEIGIVEPPVVTPDRKDKGKYLLLDGHLRLDYGDARNPNNDHLIFSKGHASPLYYAMLKAVGEIDDEELLTFRKFGSRLEGHPTPRIPPTDVATGSLGQGLPIGVGIAIAGRDLDRLPYRVWVLCGDSEMAEGSMWEAFQHAGWAKLGNLIAIVDVNRLGQTRETMLGWDMEGYAARVAAFIAAAQHEGHDEDEHERAAADGHVHRVLGPVLLGGGGLSNRLANRVRGQAGLSYDIGSAFDADSIDKSAMFVVYGITAPSNIGKVEALVAEEVQKFLTDGPGSEELHAGKKAGLELVKATRADDARLVARTLGSLVKILTQRSGKIAASVPIAPMERNVTKPAVHAMRRARAIFPAPIAIPTIGTEAIPKANAIDVSKNSSRAPIP